VIRCLFLWIRRLVGAALLGWAAWQIVRLVRPADELVGYTVGPAPASGLDLGRAIDAADALAAARTTGGHHADDCGCQDPELVPLVVPAAE